MGKRELLIIVAFVVVGVVAYQFTAPPPKAGERSFSIRQIFSGIKREISENASSAKITKTGTIPVAEGVTELRIAAARSVPLTILGERRDDIAFEMPVESTGPDEATAKTWADKVAIRTDDLGTALALGTYFPDEGTQSATLTLRVPAGLAIRVENSRQVQVSNVGAVELRNLTGDISLSDVSGTVTGSHRSGELTVAGAGSVNVTLSSSQARFRKVAASVTLTARSGECSIAESTGPITVTATNADVVINAAGPAIKVSGDGGSVKVLDATDLSVDARNMVVDVETGASSGRLTLVTTEEPLRLHLGAGPSIAIDGLAKDAEIRATDFSLSPQVDGRESRLKVTLGSGATRAVLRNSRGDIVIARRK